MISRRIAIDMRKKGEALEAVAVCAGIAVICLSAGEFRCLQKVT